MSLAQPLLPGRPSRYARWLLEHTASSANAVGSATVCGAIGGFALTLLGASAGSAAAAAVLGTVVGIVAARAHGGEVQRIAELITDLDRSVDRDAVLRQLLEELEDAREPVHATLSINPAFAMLALAAAGALRACGRDREAEAALARIEPSGASVGEWQLRCVMLAESSLARGDVSRARAVLSEVALRPDATIPPVIDALVLACEGHGRAALERLRSADGTRGWAAFTAAHARAHAFASAGDDDQVRCALGSIERWAGIAGLEMVALAKGPASSAAHAKLTRTSVYR